MEDYKKIQESSKYYTIYSEILKKLVIQDGFIFRKDKRYPRGLYPLTNKDLYVLFLEVGMVSELDVRVKEIQEFAKQQESQKVEKENIQTMLKRIRQAKYQREYRDRKKLRGY